MSMSPEQMQAMAYQQMMMQQQMQQMQRAMAMQQMGGAGGMPVAMPVGMPMFQPLAGGSPGMQRLPSGGQPGGVPMMQQFSFESKPAKKDDKKFDFVKDAMQTAHHKK
jgi:hypothetical protein